MLAYSLLSTGETWQFEALDRSQGQIGRACTPTAACCAPALRHQGIVLQPSFLIGEYLKSGALVEVLPAYRSFEFGVYAVYPTRKHASAKVRVLIDFLVEAFRAPAWLK